MWAGGFNSQLMPTALDNELLQIHHRAGTRCSVLSRVSTIAEEMEQGTSFDAGIRAITRNLERVHRKMELILQDSDVLPTEAELRTRS